MELDDTQIRKIWEEIIKPRVFSDAKAERMPVTVFLGGQPGAGKTRAAKVAQDLNLQNEITPLVGDDYRQFHPDYPTLVRTNPLKMPAATASAEGKWIGMCVDYADAHGYSISIEGTWRNADTVLKEAQRAKSIGRRTHALIVATPPALSRTHALERFTSDAINKGEARWTPPEAQQAVFHALAENVRTISRSNLIDRFSVVSNGSVIYDAPVQDDDRSYRAWEKEYRRSLTVDETNGIRSRITKIRASLPNLPLSPEDRIKVRAELDAVTMMIGKPTLKKTDIRQNVENRSQQIRGLSHSAPTQHVHKPEGPSL